MEEQMYLKKYLDPPAPTIIKCPSPPGKPDIVTGVTGEDGIRLRWLPPRYDGGAPLLGFHVELHRLGTPNWERTTQRPVPRPEVQLGGLEPGCKYQFRVMAENAAGCSSHSEISEILSLSRDGTAVAAPKFVGPLSDVDAIENEKTEFRVFFEGSPLPEICWFKDGCEIFSSRRTTIVTDGHTSTLIFHQTGLSDEGEIECTATNRAGRSVTRAHLLLRAAPSVRPPRRYEDGIIYDTHETMFLKVSVAGRPTPDVHWWHDGIPILSSERIEIINTDRFSSVRMPNATRRDRGEYRVVAENCMGEDAASFLVTVTAKPDPPMKVTATRNLDGSVTLTWFPPEDDGGCQIGNYTIEYFRTGWDMWLKATSSRQLSTVLSDLIEGSEYKFRVKAESPYGLSEPSVETPSIYIPIKEDDIKEEIERNKIEFPRAVPRKRRQLSPKIEEEGPVQTYTLDIPVSTPVPKRQRSEEKTIPTIVEPVETEKRENYFYSMRKDMMHTAKSEEKMRVDSSEFMLVLYPSDDDKLATEKRKSFQLDLEEAMSPPPMSFSAPELNSGYTEMFRPIRSSVSSTEILHEKAMDRFYQILALRDIEKAKSKKQDELNIVENNIPELNPQLVIEEPQITLEPVDEVAPKIVEPEEESLKENELTPARSAESLEREGGDSFFEDDYTASTVSTGDSETDLSEAETCDREIEALHSRIEENTTYHPRDMTKSIPIILQPIVEQPPRPLPDPNFIPKPILKKREVGQPEPSSSKPPEPSKSIFKKFAKFPMVKNPKIFSKNKNKAQNKKDKDQVSKEDEAEENTDETIEDNYQDEGRTVIEHYGNLVKEYGAARKPPVQFVKTEDLKKAADNPEPERMVKRIPVKRIIRRIVKRNDGEPTKPRVKITAMSHHAVPVRPEAEEAEAEAGEEGEPEDKPKKGNKKITFIEKRTEGDQVIVITKNISKLNAKAESNVKSAMSYVIDSCMLIVAIWLYIFKDARLAIPFILLTAYRQIQGALRARTPAWLTKWRSPQT